MIIAAWCLWSGWMILLGMYAVLIVTEPEEEVEPLLPNDGMQRPKDKSKRKETS